MHKKFIIILFLFFLTNCSAPGTALLGPVFTGATSGSAAQASLSFGTNQIVKKIQETSQNNRKKIKITQKHGFISKNTNSLHFH